MVALVLYTAVVGRLAMLRLEHSQYSVGFAAVMQGVATTAATTVPAALSVWLILAVTLGALTVWWRRGGDLTRSEALAAAIITLWSIAYVALLALGPFGGYRPAILRALLVVVIVGALLARRGGGGEAADAARAPARRGMHAGAWIAAAAFLVALGPLLLLQFGSPVSPFMDVLPLVASVQKIVAFQWYDPFANDATGFVALGRNAVGYDALSSFLALIAGLPAWLAMTTLIVPFCALQVFAIYRLGRATNGAFAGGFAALLLLHTFTWRRTPDIRGTTIAFAVGALGIAFLLAGRRRGGVRTALGGLALGLSVTVNPLIGAMAMLVGGCSLVVAWIDIGGRLIAPVAALAAGSLFASPQVLIGLVWRVPAAVLPALALAGAAGLAAVAVLAKPAPGSSRRAIPGARMLASVGVVAWVVVLHARQRSEFFDDQWLGYVLLTLLGGFGLAVAASDVWYRPSRRSGAAVPAVALALGIAVYIVSSPLRFGGDIAIRSLTSEVTTKMLYYWSPYWLALAGGTWFGMLARRWSRGAAFALALLVVIYPLRAVPESLDFDASELSLAETWTFHLAHAARGYWSGYPDRRWVLDEQWRDAVALMRDEIAAGRVRYDTHVVLVSQSQNVELALGSGVSVDVYTPQYSADSIWLVGTRVHGLDALPQALAARPAYIMIQPGMPPPSYPELADYDELMTRNLFRLYRRRDSLPGAAPAGAAVP